MASRVWAASVAIAQMTMASSTSTATIRSNVDGPRTSRISTKPDRAGPSREGHRRQREDGQHDGGHE